MAVPPKFADIGKPTNDLLGKDYPVGIAKLEVKTNASNGVNFTVNGSQDLKAGSVTGDLKIKLLNKSQGLTVSQSWSSSNALNSEVELADSLVKGLKLSLNGLLLPATGNKNAKVAAEYKQDYLFSNVALDLFKGPTVVADSSVGADGFVAGGEVAYNIQDGKVTKYAAALGYSASDYAVSVHALGNFSSFAAAYFHRVSSDVEAGAKAVWDKKAANSVAIEVGTKIAFDKNTFVKAKANNAGILGLALTQSLRDGVKLAIGGSFDTARFNENAHKLGFSLTLEA